MQAGNKFVNGLRLDIKYYVRRMYHTDWVMKPEKIPTQYEQLNKLGADMLSTDPSKRPNALQVCKVLHEIYYQYHQDPYF